MHLLFFDLVFILVFVKICLGFYLLNFNFFFHADCTTSKRKLVIFVYDKMLLILRLL